MKAKRMFAVLLTGIMASSALAGCGGGGSSTSSTAAPAAQSTAAPAAESTAAPAAESTAAPAAESTAPAASTEVTTITVWNNAAHEVNVRQPMIDEFNNGIGKEEGIYIDYQTYGDKYADTIKIAAQAGEAPDLFSYDSKWGMDFIDAGYLVALEDLPGSEDLLEAYKPYLSNQGQIFNGKTYTLPYSLTTYGFVINKDLFKEAGIEKNPETWEEVIEDAKKITEATNGRAYGLGLSSTLWTISSFYTMGNGQNVGHYGYDWNAKQFNYSAYAPLVKAIDQMIADGTVFPGFENLDGDGVRAQFAAGNIGMMGAASFDCSVYTNQFPAVCDWEVIDIPKFSADAKTYKRFGNTVNLLCVGTKALESEERAAKVEKVLEFFYDDADAGVMYEEGLYIPVRAEAVALATKEPTMKGWKEFASFDEVFAMPPVPDTLISIEGTTYREAMLNIWTNPALDDVDAILADVDARYNAALAAADQDKVNLYVLPDGVTSEKSAQ